MSPLPDPHEGCPPLATRHQAFEPFTLTLSSSSLCTRSPEPEPTSRPQPRPEPSASTPTCREKRFPGLVSPSRSKDRHVPEGFPAFWAPVTAAADFPSGSYARSPLRCPPPPLPPGCAANTRPVLTHRTLSQPLILSFPTFPIPTHPSRSSSVVTSSRKPCQPRFQTEFASPALCPTASVEVWIWP